MNSERGILIWKPATYSGGTMTQLPLVEYYPGDGTRMTFFGPDPTGAIAATAMKFQGQFWKTEFVDSTGTARTTYVGNATSSVAAVAASDAFDSWDMPAGDYGTAAARTLIRPKVLHDASGATIEYEYYTAYPKHLKKITITKDSAVVRTVDFHYYDELTAELPEPEVGTPPALGLGRIQDRGYESQLGYVVVTTPQSSGPPLEQKYHYRYYVHAAGNMPGYSGEYDNSLWPLNGADSLSSYRPKGTIGPEGMRSLERDVSSNTFGFLGGPYFASPGEGVVSSPSDSSLIPYADSWIQRVRSAPEEGGGFSDWQRNWVLLTSGGCGCSSSSSSSAQSWVRYGLPPEVFGTPSATAGVYGGYTPSWVHSLDNSYSPGNGVDVLRPDGTFGVEYFDPYGQSLGSAATVAPLYTSYSLVTQPWQASLIDRDARGRILRKYAANAIDSFTFANGDSRDFVVKSNAGLVRQWTYETPGATEPAPDNNAWSVATSYLPETPLKESISKGISVGVTTGAGGNITTRSVAPTVISEQIFKKPVSGGTEYAGYAILPPAAANWGGNTTRKVAKPLPVTSKAYYADNVQLADTITSTSNEQISYDYDFWGASGPELVADQGIVKRATRSRTVLWNLSDSGSSQTFSSSTYYYPDGKVALTQTEDNRWTYFEYDLAGQLVERIDDVDAEGSGSVSTALTTFGVASQVPSDGRHIVTSMTYDNLGRLTRKTIPSSGSTIRAEEFFYFRSPDGGQVTLSVPLVTSASTSPSTKTYYGPVGYRIENLNGKVEVEAELAISGGSTTTAPLAVNGGSTTGAWLDVSSGKNIVTAVQTDVVSISRLRVNRYNKAGTQLEESRVYHTIPTSETANWFAWLEATKDQADITRYWYDPMGRVARVQDPTGTLTRTVYDYRGLPVERWIGTDDDWEIEEDAGTTAIEAGWAIGNGRTSATDSTVVGTYGDMTKVSAFEYDPGEGATDGWLRKKIEDADGDWSTTGDQRVTEYLRDFRGRVIVERMLNPTATTPTPLADYPQTLRKYDNLDRVIAQATYASTASLTIETDPTSATSGRLSLTETTYDGRGQVAKTTVYRINQSSGAVVSGGDLVTNFFYDPAGRVIKTSGTSVTKTRYDRLGRAIRRWTLAKDAGGSFADNYSSSIGTLVANAGGTVKDVVLELQQSIYDRVEGTLSHQIRVSRSPAEPTGGTPGLGTLGDLNTDNTENPTSLSTTNMKGRVAVTSYFYDDMDRLEITAFAGTGGLPDYNPNGSTTSGSYTLLVSAPSASSAEALVSKTEYAPDGTISIATDPAGKRTKTEHDPAGRVNKTIRNYVTTTPGFDENQTVEYTYDNGLLATMIARIPSAQTSAGASGDQTTTYVYGTTKGTLGNSSSGASSYASRIATGHLLNRTVYPPGTNSTTDGTRSVHIAYNALGESAWTKDQLGNVIATTYDNAGRITSTAATVATAFSPTSTAVQLDASDDFVGSINLEYDSRGMVYQVTQKGSGTSSNTVRDQLRYTYDDYGLLTQIRQKTDGAINTAGTDGYVIGYSNSRVAPGGGRTGVRRTGMTLPGAGASSGLTYQYGASGDLNDLVGRVEAIDLVGSSSNIESALYTYMGSGTLAGSKLSEIGLSNRLFGSTASATDDHVISGFDRFGRQIESRWGRNAGTTSSPIDSYAFWVSIGYDNASNVTNTVDHLLKGRDVRYVNDGLHRLIAAQEGTYSSGSIANQTFKQRWGVDTVSGWQSKLSHTGNWLEFYEDVGSGTSTTPTETRTNAAVNEIISRTVGSTTTSFQYNAAGQLIDDGEKLYMYDAFGRLRYAQTRTSGGVRGGLLEESTYNGLGHRIRSHSDQDFDNDTDSNDPWIDMVYDDSWRIVATFRSGDATDRPRERFVYHCAGMNGRGSSSYIDDVILRERSDSVGWTDSPAPSLGNRLYYLQNWRHDVCVTLRQNGGIVERTTYTSYGVPRTYTGGDFNHDGFVDDDDFALFQTPYNGPAQIDYSPGATRAGSGDYGEYDLDHNGSIDDGDFVVFAIAYNNLVGAQPGELSHRDESVGANVDSRIGYSGYRLGSSSVQWSARERLERADLGLWSTRDSYAKMFRLPDLYEYVRSQPIGLFDPYGLDAMSGAAPTSGTLFPPSPIVRPAVLSCPVKLSPPDGPVSCDNLKPCFLFQPKKPGANTKPNGCGAGGPPASIINPGLRLLPTNALFTPCCNAHDACYGTCNSSRKACDDGMLLCHISACFGLYSTSLSAGMSMWNAQFLLLRCLGTAQDFHDALRFAGQGPFCAAQKENCECIGSTDVFPKHVKPFLPFR